MKIFNIKLIFLLLASSIMALIAGVMISAPGLVAPGANAVLTSCPDYRFTWNHNLEWYFEIRKYHFVLDTDQDFSDVFWRTYPTTNYQDIGLGLLQDNTTYYWGVATEARQWYGPIPGAWEWSSFAIRSFTTNFPGLETISPAQNATDVSQLPRFRWSEPCYIFDGSWSFILDDNADFSSPILNVWLGMNAYNGVVFSAYPALAPGVKYYWKANRWSSIFDLWSGWTNIGIFTTGTSNPFPPSLLTPENNSELASDGTTLSWKPILGVVHYQVQLDDEESFIDPLYNDSTNATSYDVSDIYTEGADYYWRARIKYETCGYSCWSDTFHFSIQCPRPDVPVLTEPADSAVSIAVDLVYLQWEEVEKADLYHIELDDNHDFSSVEFAANTNECFDQCPGLTPHTTYYWRVRSYHQICGYGEWSSAWSFTTTDATGIKSVEGKAPPHSYELLQNFPNPFNMFTTIRFELPQPDFAIVEVYNTLGKKICTLLNKNLAAGSWMVNWDGTDENGFAVPSGVYIYRLSTHNYTSSRKMMIIK